MQDCIAWDWIQSHVKVPFRNYEDHSCKYYIELQPYGTRHFKKVFLIYTHKDGEVVATLVHDPHMGAMPEDFGLLKIENKRLYQNNLSGYVKELHKELNLKFVNYTRVDVAYDFQKFHRGLSPRTFIERYVSKQYLKRGRAKGKNGAETGIHTDNKTKKKIASVMLQVLEETGVELDELLKKKLEGNLKRKLKKGYQYTPPEKVKILTNQAEELEFESLKFGSEKSELSYILYNKTKEMQDVKVKPWIQDHWRSHGWDGKSEVWRIEFSFKSSTRAFIEYDGDGEVVNTMKFNDINLLDHIHAIFKYNFNKYFAFVTGEKKCRKDRMKPVVLLKNISSNTVRIDLSEKKEAKRSDKIWLKKLMEVNQEMRGQDFELAVFTTELMGYYMLNRGLEEWAKKAIPSAYDAVSNNAAFKRQAMVYTLMSQPGQQRLKQLQIRRYNAAPTSAIGMFTRQMQYTGSVVSDKMEVNKLMECYNPLLVRRNRALLDS